jgi:hypothetical protein
MPEAGFNVGALLGVMGGSVRDTDARHQAAIREIQQTGFIWNSGNQENHVAGSDFQI